MENKKDTLKNDLLTGIFSSCPFCGGETFENEYKDIQCSNCRRVLPLEVDAKKRTSVSLIDGHIDGED